MDRCDICYKTGDSLSTGICDKCKLSICPDCLYYTRYYRLIKEVGFLDKEIDEEIHFCKIHFIEFINGFNSEVLQNILTAKFVIKGDYEENNKKIFYIREFNGKDIGNIISDAIQQWPSDEWKDWNTM
jgi:hypothetical protein